LLLGYVCSVWNRGKGDEEISVWRGKEKKAIEARSG
jgi:hypothetical protein